VAQQNHWSESGGRMLFHALGSFAFSELSERRFPPLRSVLALAYSAIMNSAVEEMEDEQIESRMPLWLAIIANALSGGLALQFFWLSPSDWVRPMGWLFWTLASEINAVVVLPLVLLNLKRLRGRTWPKYAVVLSLTPAPLGLLIEKLAHLVVGYHYSQ